MSSRPSATQHAQRSQHREAGKKKGPSPLLPTPSPSLTKAAAGPFQFSLIPSTVIARDRAGITPWCMYVLAYMLTGPLDIASACPQRSRTPCSTAESVPPTTRPRPYAPHSCRHREMLLRRGRGWLTCSSSQATPSRRSLRPPSTPCPIFGIIAGSLLKTAGGRRAANDGARVRLHPLLLPPARYVPPPLVARARLPAIPPHLSDFR